LNRNINHALQQKQLLGVQFKEEGLHLAHQFYSDNASLVVCAGQENLLKCQDVFDTFGHVSGLKVDWKRTSAVLISPLPKPAALEPFE
jgi:hypothetical protein